MGWTLPNIKINLQGTDTTTTDWETLGEEEDVWDGEEEDVDEDEVYSHGSHQYLINNSRRLVGGRGVGLVTGEANRMHHPSPKVLVNRGLRERSGR